MIITIDGPAGAGKSTVAKEISRRFGYFHLDSGALYRAIGYACSLKGADLNNLQEVISVAKSIKVEFTEEGKVILNGQDVTWEIRKPESGYLASQVARFKEVREVVVKLLREMAKGKKIVIDGRDAGSYIFPDADLKIYLTATPEERAKRRYEELKKRGFNVSYEEVLKEVVERDERDKSRPFAPLVVPEGDIVIDTTGKGLETVISEISQLIKNGNDC